MSDPLSKAFRRGVRRLTALTPTNFSNLSRPWLRNQLPCTTNHETLRWASGKNGTSSKRQAMQRQQQNNPPTSQEPLPPPPNLRSPKTFATKFSTEESLIQPVSSFSPQAPIQISPFETSGSKNLSEFWETDKRQSLSALPDEAAELLEKEALFDPTVHLPYAPQDWKGYEPSTPLFEFLMQRIGVSGRAITTAEYMRHALTHPQFGYYTNPPKPALDKALGGGGVGDDFEEDEWDIEEETKISGSTNDSTLIGPKGDFVTAPEVSHVFGHCLCVWFITQWKSALLNKPSKIQLVELGPGRGTLMMDILQLATTSKLEDFGQAIQVVSLIEASRELRAQQEQALQKALGHMVDFDFVQVSSFAPPPAEGKNAETETKEGKDSKKSVEKKFQIRVEWHDDFRSFQQQREKDVPVFMVLQEFMDALPVHVFQQTEEGWRERLIDVASTEDDGATVDPTIPQSKDDGSDGKETDSTSSPKLLPRLRQVLAPDVTPAVELFLEGNQNQYSSAPVGSVIEICPEGLVLAQDMAQVLEESQGVALVIDYGQDGTGDTLRAFSNHKQVALTSLPGQVDVTADVDFFALRESVNERPLALAKNARAPVDEDRRIHAFGPVKQGEFLMRMGAADMVIHSMEKDETSPELAQSLTDALKFLVMPEHMGERFKVLALAPKREGIFAPAGMET